ncbi:MAG: CHASE4 domain-containing protein [Phycisphaerales bacterium]
MKLRALLGLTILTVFALLTVADLLVYRFVSAPGYQRLEDRLARSDADRVDAAITRELDGLDKFALEWSDWDDSYKWVMGESDAEAFVKSNFAAEDYWRQCRTPVFIFTDRTGKVMFKSVRDPETYQPRAIAEFDCAQFSQGGRYFPGHDAPEAKGLVTTELGPALYVSRPVVPTAGDEPSAGRFIAIRFLDESAVAALREQVGVNFALVASAASGSDTRLDIGEDRSVITATTTLTASTADQPISAVCEIPRSVTAEGVKSGRLSLTAMLVSAAAITLCLIGALQLKVVQPIIRLRKHAMEVGATGDFTRRFGAASKDEIGELAREFDTMVASLGEAKREVADMSRRAGMAEVASGVLHNVGNAMNSARVSISTVRRIVSDSKVSSVRKVSDLIGSQPDLADFFTNDARGRQLPGFVNKLSESLESEQGTLDRECDRLDACLMHINDIVRTHQDIARAPEVAEFTSLAAVIEGAAVVVRPSFERHGLTLDVERAPLVTGAFYRAKVQQVLVNLLTNAEQAIKASGNADGRVRVASGTTGAGRVWIEVTDTGRGFTAEQRASFFRQGYTTKADGHGVGLHYCAISLGQIGGTIDATSEGPGAGATFRIEFQVEATERRAAA